jgi:hypothetical protein
MRLMVQLTINTNYIFFIYWNNLSNLLKFNKILKFKYTRITVIYTHTYIPEKKIIDTIHQSKITESKTIKPFNYKYFNDVDP